MKKPYTTFTPAEDSFIKKNYLKMPVKSMAREMGRSGFGVSNRMKILKLKKPAELVEQHRHVSRYKKGRNNPNKGKSRDEFMTAEQIENSKKNQFKKGIIPHNLVPINTEAVREFKNGGKYVFIKLGTKNWQFKHRVLWKQHHGKIPAGKVITFIDGNTLNCVITNLKLTTKSEIMRNTANTYHHQTPTEIKDAISALNKLTKQLKKQKNGTKQND